MWPFVLITVVVVALVSFLRVKNRIATLYAVDPNDPGFIAAIEHARSTLPFFWEKLAESDPEERENFAIKVRIEDERGIEHFWLVDVELVTDLVRGKINNDPGVVKSVKIDEVVTLPLSDVSDWMIMTDAGIVGNYTMRFEISRMPEARQEKLIGMLADSP